MEILQSLYQQRYLPFHSDSIRSQSPSSISSSNWKRPSHHSLNHSLYNIESTISGISSQSHSKMIEKNISRIFRRNSEEWKRRFHNKFRPFWRSLWSTAKLSVGIPPARENLRRLETPLNCNKKTPLFDTKKSSPLSSSLPPLTVIGPSANPQPVQSSKSGQQIADPKPR